MNKERYQAAFSWVEPSEAALEQTMNQASVQKRTRKPRLGAIMLAAVFSVSLLTGGVFAAVHWFSIHGAEDYKTPPILEKDSPTPVESQAPVQQILELSHPEVQSYVGFTLPASYQDRANYAECCKLTSQLEYDGKLDAIPAEMDLDGVFSRYFGTDADGNWLTVEVQGSPWLSRDSYFTQGSFEVEQEQTINGLETAWIHYTGASWGESWHLFCRSEASDCVLIVSSTASFEAAAQALQDLTLVDTHIPVENHQNDFYALRQPELGAEWSMIFSIDVSRELLNARLEDPDTDLSALFNTVQLEQKEKNVYLAATIRRDYHNAAEPGETILQEMDINGLPAVLLRSDGLPYLRLYNETEKYAIELHSFKNLPSEDVLIPLLEEAAEKLEVTRIGVVKQAPFEFSPFSVG